MSRPHATRNLATIHNTILALFARLGLRNVAQARRFFDAHPEKAFPCFFPLIRDFEKAIGSTKVSLSVEGIGDTIPSC